MKAMLPDELDLAYLPMEEDAFAADPLPYFAAARERHPWLAKSMFGYVVYQYQAMRDLLRLEHKMSQIHSRIVDIMGARDTAWGDFMDRSIVNLEGATHKRIRDIVAPAFSPKQANLNRPLMREVISRQLDEWAPLGAFDFEEFASFFPITVMCRLIGASPDAIPALRPYLETLGLGPSQNPGLLVAFQEAYRFMREFVEQLVAGRRQAGAAPDSNDLLDLLLRAQAKDGLTELELVELLIFLFVAGYDTSKNVLTLSMYVLLDKPEVYRRCAQDMAFCSNVMDEMFRYLGVATSARVVAEDITYQNVLLPKGCTLLLPWNVTGRDPDAFKNADVFEPERSDKLRIGFGLGAHICLGQYIAKAQLDEGLHLIAQRITNPQRTGTVGWRPFVGVWGLRGLPIKFDPQPFSRSSPSEFNH